MGVRGRLIAVTTLVLGLTVLASLLLSLRLEAWEERRAHSERSEQIVDALASAVAADLASSQPGRAAALVAPVERDRDAFGLAAVYVLDKDGVDLAHADSPRLDRFLRALMAGDDADLVDPPPPAWPKRIAHPIFVGGKRYVVVGVVDEGGVNERLIERNRRLGATHLVISLVGLLVLLVALSSEVLRPLRQLAAMAESLGRGPPRSADINGGREIQQVKDALVDAGARLARQREILESEVALRTADLAAANATLSTMNEQLQQLALTDPLTGLFNRRALEQALVHEVTRQKRGRRPFSLMMIDVDHFKKLNDGFGHAAGDDVLRALARLIPGALRASDVVARVGGEEFVVLLLDTELPHALNAAEKVREAVRGAAFVSGGSSVGRVTVSLGLASWPQHGDSAEVVLAAADKALYAAKAAGRDRVLAAPTPASTSKEPEQEL